MLNRSCFYLQNKRSSEGNVTSELKEQAGSRPSQQEETGNR